MLHSHMIKWQCGFVLFNKTTASSAANNSPSCHMSQFVRKYHLCHPPITYSRWLNASVTRAVSTNVSVTRAVSTHPLADVLSQTDKEYPRRQTQGRGQHRSEVSRRVTEQLRQDVFVQSLMYKDSIIMTRRPWEDYTQSARLINNCVASDEVKQLSSLGNDDILAMMYCIMNRQELLKHKHLLESLEEECCRRVNTLDLRTILLMADSFYVLEHSQTRYMSTVLHAVDLHWSSLAVTPHRLIQLLLYIGTYRNAPVQLMERIEDFFVENISDVTGREIGLICHAFFSSNTSLRSFALMNKMADIVLRDLHLMKPYLVANVLKVFRHANFSNFTFYDRLGNADMLQGESYVSTVIHFVTTYSAMRFVHDALYESAMRNFSHCLVYNKHKRAQIRMKDFTKFLWAYSTVQRPVSRAILDAAVDCVRRDQRLWRRHPETFIECLVSLAMNCVYPHDLINYALSPDFLRFKRGMLPVDQVLGLV